MPVTPRTTISPQLDPANGPERKSLYLARLRPAEDGLSEGMPQAPDQRHTSRFRGRRHPDQVRIAPAAIV